MQPIPFIEILKAISTYGLAVVLVVVGFFFVSRAVWKLIIRLMDESQKRDERLFQESSKRDERIAMILDGSLKTLSSNIDNVAKVIIAHENRETEFFLSMREADRHSREEHEKMMENQTVQTQILVSVQALLNAQAQVK